MEPARPTLDSEPCYENMGSAEEGPRFTREEVRSAGWHSVLGGANAGLTYGGNGIWQWYRDGEHFDDVPWIEWMGWPLPWQEGLDYPGADDYAIVKDVLTSFGFEALEPRQDLLVDTNPDVRAAVLPEDDVVLVYTSEANAISLDCDVTSAEWFHPGTTQRIQAAIQETNPVTVDAPNWDGDAVLIGRR